jgi:hypothetical protein
MQLSTSFADIIIIIKLGSSCLTIKEQSDCSSKFGQATRASGKQWILELLQKSVAKFFEP